MKGKDLKISQCMIVKNEEENIERALLWGKEIFREQIVVDTGSTDRTVELAEAMGAKVCHFEWIDDFAAAKNFALEQATGDWIAFLDADEYIKPEEVEQIIPLIHEAQEVGCLALQTSLYSVNEQEEVSGITRQNRFFKRIPELRFHGRIHENLLLEGGSLDKYLLRRLEGPIIYHTGYTPEIIERKKKNERNLRILLKTLEEKPENYHFMGDLGDWYMNAGDEQEAAHWYREAVQRIPRTRAAQCDRNVKSFLCLLDLLARQEAESELLRLYEDIHTRFTGVYEADYIVGLFYVKTREDHRKGVVYLEHAMQILEQYGTATYGPGMLKNLPETWEMLADCHYRNGDLKSCVSRCVGLLKADKSRVASLELLLKAFSAENPRNIINFLGKLYDFSQEEDRLILSEACQRSGSVGVMECLENLK